MLIKGACQEEEFSNTTKNLCPNSHKIDQLASRTNAAMSYVFVASLLPYMKMQDDRKHFEIGTAEAEASAVISVSSFSIKIKKFHGCGWEDADTSDTDI